VLILCVDRSITHLHQFSIPCSFSHFTVLIIIFFVTVNGFVFMILVGSASGAVLLFVVLGLICCCCCRGKPKREPLPLEAAYGQRDDSKKPLLSSEYEDDGYGPSPSNHPKYAAPHLFLSLSFPRIVFVLHNSILSMVHRTDARRSELAQKYSSLRASQRSN
jgi:hypothetical protein